MIRRSKFVAGLVFLAVASGGMGGLSAAEKTKKSDPPPAPPPPPVVAPYDDGLLRLSEILGAVHYLRQLCGANEGTLWRDQMQSLLDSEQPEGDRLARIVDRFNRGYESFKSVYLTCTPAATLAVDRYLQEGAKIARDIAARYGREE